VIETPDPCATSRRVPVDRFDLGVSTGRDFPPEPS
jgi:hypothetical protein